MSTKFLQGAVVYSGTLSAVGITDNGSTNINGGSLYLGNGTSNFLIWNGVGIAAPSFTTRSAGTKAVWYPAVSGSEADYATGINGYTLWNSVPQNLSSYQFAWYAGTTAVATLSGTGNFSTVGTIAGVGITDTGTTTLNSLNFAASGTQQNINQAGTGLHIGPLGTNPGPVDIFANGQGNAVTAQFAANGNVNITGGVTAVGFTDTGGSITSTSSIESNGSFVRAYLAGTAPVLNAGYLISTVSSTSGAITLGGGGGSGSAQIDFGVTTAGVITLSAALVAPGITDSGSTIIQGGALYLQNGTSNWLSFNTNGVAAPAFTTRSAGTKAIWYPSISGSAADYATGINGNTLWNSVPTASQQFVWYAGTTSVAVLSGAGALTLSSYLNATGWITSTGSINANNSAIGSGTIGQGFCIGTAGTDTSYGLCMGSNYASGTYKIAVLGAQYGVSIAGIRGSTLFACQMGTASGLALDASGNVGISGSYYGSGINVGQLQATNTSGGLLGYFSGGGSCTAFVYQEFTNAGGDSLIGIDQSAGGGLAIGSSAYALVINNQANFPLQLGTDNNVRMTIAANGAASFTGTLSAVGITDTGTTVLNSLDFAASGTQQNIQQSGTGLHIGPLGTNTGPIDIYANGQGNAATAIFTAAGNLTITGTLVLGNPLAVAQGGTGGSIGPGTAITSATSGINTTDTILVTDPLGSGNSLAVGTVFLIKLQGTCTATVANNSTFTIRFGTAGTTSDATIATFVLASAASGSSVPFDVEIFLTIRTIGSGTSATNYGMLRLVNNGTTGIATTATAVVTPTASGFNSSISAGILSISYKSAATTTTCTFQNAIISALHY